MKKIILSVCFTFTFLVGFGQIVVDDGFENATCSNVPPNYSPFFDGCVNDWISTHGSPGINQGNVTAYEGNNYAYMYVEYNGFGCWPDAWRGEGIALNYNFQQGFTYEISYAVRGQNNPPPFATFERNWVLTNGLTNTHGGNNGCPTGEIIPNTPPNSQFLPTPSYNDNSWTVNTHTFTAGANYSQLWFRARNDHSTINAQVFSQMYLDDIVIKIIDQPCVPDEVTITADGTDIKNDLNYTIPCGETCVTLNAINITNATYNTTSPSVLTNLNGLFCVIDDSLTSFTATITGTDSCGDPYSQNVTINLEQDCCPHIDMVRLFDNSYQNPSGESPGNYTDYTDQDCIPIFDVTNPLFQQINVSLSQPNVYRALYIDLNGDGDFDDPGEERTNALDGGTGGFGVPFGSLITNGTVTGGETIRVIVSDSPITDPDTIPECGEMEDYVLCDPCPDELEIIAYCEDPCLLETFPLKVQDQDGNIITILDGATFLWTNVTTGATSTSDVVFTEEFEEWTLKVTLANGCEYELEYQFICCDDEINVVAYECPTPEDIAVLEAQLGDMKSSLAPAEYQKYADFLVAAKEGKGEVKDCDPCETGLFIIRVEDGTGNLLTGFTSITWSDGLYANQNVRWGLVDTLYTVTVEMPADNDEDVCTYTFEIIYECETACNVTAPTNLQVNGASLTWDPVPGAVSYIISSPSKIKIDCCNFGGVSIAPVQTTNTSYLLPVSLQEQCFVWQVTAVCADGSQSPVSVQACHLPTRRPGKEKVQVYPNPSNGQMNIQLELVKDTKVELKIYTYEGVLLRTLNNIETKDGKVNMDFNSGLRRGMYLFTFNTGETVITKRIVIE